MTTKAQPTSTDRDRAIARRDRRLGDETGFGTPLLRPAVVEPVDSPGSTSDGRTSSPADACDPGDRRRLTM